MKIEGNVVAKNNVRICIIASRFNEFIVSKLVDGAIDGLVRHDVLNENIDVAWVPGAFEIPVIQRIVIGYDNQPKCKTPLPKGLNIVSICTPNK